MRQLRVACLGPMQMANEVGLYVEGEEMMSCLTEETRQTAPRFAHDEERNCRVEGRRTVLKTCIA